MCAVSMIGDYYRDKWTDPYRWPNPYPTPPLTPVRPYPPVVPPNRNPLPPDEAVKNAIELTKKVAEEARKGEHMTVSYEKFAELQKQVVELRKEVMEMKELLIRAKKYDEENAQPHCEMEDKVSLLKSMAKIFGVDIANLLKD